MPCDGTSSCGKLTGRYHACAASQNSIHWDPIQVLLYENRNPLNLLMLQEFGFPERRV